MDLQGEGVSLGQLLITAIRMERLKVDILIMSTCSALWAELRCPEISHVLLPPPLLLMLVQIKRHNS